MAILADNNANETHFEAYFLLCSVLFSSTWFVTHSEGSTARIQARQKKLCKTITLEILLSAWNVSAVRIDRQVSKGVIVLINNVQPYRTENHPKRIKTRSFSYHFILHTSDLSDDYDALDENL